MRKLCIWLAIVFGGAGVMAAACHDEVPGPGGPRLPFPPSELPPQGPRPGPLVPTPVIRPDGAILSIETHAQFNAAAIDAAVDVLELPPNPDGSIVRDAANPVAHQKGHQKGDGVIVVN